jgi:hypothetical protein
MILLWEGSISCDCKHQYQMGVWCRHDWALWYAGMVDFKASLGIDAYYGRKGSPDGPTVLYPVEGAQAPFHVSKPWNYAALSVVVSPADLTHARFSPADQELEAAGNKQVSESAGRKNRLYDVGSGANSAAARTKKKFDELLTEMEKLLSEDTRGAKVNKGKTAQFNPAPKNRNVLELAKNKSSKS